MLLDDLELSFFADEDMLVMQNSVEAGKIVNCILKGNGFELEIRTQQNETFEMVSKK